MTDNGGLVNLQQLANRVRAPYRCGARRLT